MATPSHFQIINKKSIFQNKNRARHSSGKRIEQNAGSTMSLSFLYVVNRVEKIKLGGVGASSFRVDKYQLTTIYQ